DYWWQSLKQINDLGLETLFFIQNNSYRYKDTVIYGTRGWISRDSEDFNENDEKVFRRELLRLEMSLESQKQAKKKIVMIHHPPFNMDLSPNEFVTIMKDYGVDICVYGHLHSDGHRFAVEGEIEGILFHCISCDYIDFKPKIILGE
ncbi:MAG TPA: metallophosphoesterase, partial [Tissierellaceae bacterium]|nr:metallophosphoesterase [Tissierellaceae bacterium]